jgi:hypothetical protein
MCPYGQPFFPLGSALSPSSYDVAISFRIVTITVSTIVTIIFTFTVIITVIITVTITVLTLKGPSLPR